MIMANTTANKKNTFLNWVPVKLIHQATATKNGKTNTFFNISFPYPASSNGFASVSVSNGQVFAASKKNGDVNDNFRSVLLGAPDKVRQVSIKTADGYAKIELTNAQIFDAFEADRKAYKATNQAVAKA
jgi:hypothetical protein